MKRKHPTSRPLKALATLLGFLLIVAGLFFSVKFTVNSEGFFRSEYEKLGNAQAMGMETEDLVAATMRMIDYMEGRVDSIDLMVEVHGESVSMFNDRERAHMVDVRALYQGWRTAAWAFLGAAALFLLFWGFISKQSRRLYTAARAFLLASILFLALMAAVIIWVLVDFSSFWTAFHHLFFTNDLWILNGLTDRMINMMPLQLFYDIIVRIALTFLIPWLALAIACIIVVRRSRRRWDRNSRYAMRRAVDQHDAMLDAEKRRAARQD